MCRVRVGIRGRIVEVVHVMLVSCGLIFIVGFQLWAMLPDSERIFLFSAGAMFSDDVHTTDDLYRIEMILTEVDGRRRRLDPRSDVGLPPHLLRRLFFSSSCRVEPTPISPKDLRLAIAADLSRQLDLSCSKLRSILARRSVRATALEMEIQRFAPDGETKLDAHGVWSCTL